VASIDRLSDNIALFWNLYDSVVTGTRILNDVAEGVGAVSKAIVAIDYFLDRDKADENDVEGAESPVSPADESPVQHLSPSGTCQKASKDDPLCKIPNVSKVVDETTGELPKSFNGCGALGFHIRDANLPVGKLTDCCPIHDKCYGAACRASKRDCDNKLKTCLFAVCDAKTVARTDKQACRAASKLLFTGVMALSYQQYGDAQSLLKCPGRGGDRGRGRR